MDDNRRTGTVLQVDAAAYHRDPCEEPSLSASVAKALVGQSPKHAWLRHPRLGAEPFKPTEAMADGTLLHALLLGQPVPTPADDPNVAIIPCDNFRTKAARELRDAALADGRVPMSTGDLAKAMAGVEHMTRVADILESKLRHMGVVFDRGDSEMAITWTDYTTDGEPVQCRSMLDHVTDEEDAIVDIKTCRSAHPRAIEKAMVQFGYDIQHCAYTRALAAVQHRIPEMVEMRFAFVELTPPYCCTVVEPAGSMRALGEMRWQRAVDTWAACLASGKWPEYTADGTHRAEAPSWALNDEMAQGGDDDQDV